MDTGESDARVDDKGCLTTGFPHHYQPGILYSLIQAKEAAYEEQSKKWAI